MTNLWLGVIDVWALQAPELLHQSALREHNWFVFTNDKVSKILFNYAIVVYWSLLKEPAWGTLSLMWVVNVTPEL